MLAGAEAGTETEQTSKRPKAAIMANRVHDHQKPMKRCTPPITAQIEHGSQEQTLAVQKPRKRVHSRMQGDHTTSLFSPAHRSPTAQPLARAVFRQMPYTWPSPTCNPACASLSASWWAENRMALLQVAVGSLTARKPVPHLEALPNRSVATLLLPLRRQSSVWPGPIPPLRDSTPL